MYYFSNNKTTHTLQGILKMSPCITLGTQIGKDLSVCTHRHEYTHAQTGTLCGSYDTDVHLLGTGRLSPCSAGLEEFVQYDPTHVNKTAQGFIFG